MSLRNTSLFITLVVLSSLTFYLHRPSLTLSATNHVVISEVQIGGGGDTSVTTDEFVELYNPNSESVDISGWKLMKKTAAVDAVVTLVSIVPGSTSIPGHGYYLIAHTDYDGSVSEDLTYSDTSFSTNNTVILTDSSDTVIDKVGMGTANDKENASASSPANNRSIERKASSSSTSETMSAGGLDQFLGNGEDTDDNSLDFVYRTLVQGVDPQNSSSPTEPIEATPIPTQMPTNTPTPTTEPSPTSTPTVTPSPTETPSPTVTPTDIPAPSLTPTSIPATPTPIATITPTPSDFPSPTPRIIAQFPLSNRVLTCSMNYRLINVFIFKMWIPSNVSCL